MYYLAMRDRHSRYQQRKRYQQPPPARQGGGDKGDECPPEIRAEADTTVAAQRDIKVGLEPPS